MTRIGWLCGVAFAAVLTTAIEGMPLQAQETPVDDAYNTGEFQEGDPARDLFWYFLNGQVASPGDGNQAYILDGHDAWFTAPEGSEWVALSATADQTAETNFWTTYYTTFSVTQPDLFFLAGIWASDNNAEMYLNGQYMGSIGERSFKDPLGFKLESGFMEENTLAFQVYNGSSATGLLVADVQGTVTPEPMTLLLLGTGLVGIWGVARSRRSKDGEA